MGSMTIGANGIGTTRSPRMTRAARFGRSLPLPTPFDALSLAQGIVHHRCPNDG